MLSLQMIEKQIKNDQPNLMFILDQERRIAARFLRDLLIACSAYRAGNNVKSVPGELIPANAQGISMSLREMVMNL
jgi:hypothetical protein